MAFLPARDTPNARFEVPSESGLHSASFTPMDLGSLNVVRSGMEWGRSPHATTYPSSLGCASINTIPTQLIQEAISSMIDPSTRLLTPSNSGDEGSEGSSDEQVVSVSSSFYPGAHPDHNIVFRTNDHVLFYLNSSILKSISTHAFETVLPPTASGSAATSPMLIASPSAASRGMDDVIDIPESSAIFNVIAHALYDTSCARHAPTLDIIEEAVDRMPIYGIIPALHILPGKELYNLLLTHAPISALRVYALAAKHKLHELAKQASAHTLSVSMSLVTDDLATRMGSVYLKNLMLLHVARKEAFKTIVLPTPGGHVPTKGCTVDDQRKLHRAWALAAAYLAWDGRIDVPIVMLQKTFSSLEENLTCDMCKVCLKTRIKDVMVQWAAVKHTI